MGNSISSFFYCDEFKTSSITKFNDNTRIYVADKNRDFWIGDLESRLNNKISQNTPSSEIGD